MAIQNLSGKSALVTGGARRIGREIALEFARAGADVSITYRTSKAEAAQTVQGIEALGRRVQAIECDVRSEASVRKAVAAAAAFHGRIDVLVNTQPYSNPSRSIKSHWINGIRSSRLMHAGRSS